MKQLLITGFDPFAHYSVNPSWLAVKALPATLAGFALTKVLLPNVYDLEWKVLQERLPSQPPELVLLTGMNSGSTKVCLDYVAVNVRDARIQDNMGRQPRGQEVVPGAAAKYYATIPARSLVARLQREGYPVALTPRVNGFLCNDVFYLAARHFAGTATRVGFVHIPYVPEMVLDERKALPLEESVAVLRRLIELLAETI